MKTFFLLFTVVFSLAGFAQKKFVPSINKGTKLTYILKDGGDVSHMSITLDSLANDYVKFGWSMETVGTGGWILKKNSIENANGGYWSNLEPGVQLELAETQSVVLLSKAQWKAIQNDKKLELDGQAFSRAASSEQQPYKLGNKDVDCILLQSENGNTRIWVLNNPTAPIMLKIEGNPVGVDAELTSVES